MSDDQQQPDGFRSRDQELKKRINIRKQILAQYKRAQHSISPIHQTQEKYIGLSHSLAIKKDQSDNEDVDMFADQSENHKNTSHKVHQEEITDESGYYNIYSGKIVSNGRYKIVEKVGKGMFGVVAKAQDTTNNNSLVALKIIRKNEMMVMSGQRQYKILSSIKKTDYVMGVFDYFHEDGHLFLVVELMGPDLRTFTRKNQDKITLQNVRQYAISMFMSLHDLRKNKIIHADIKPDNFLYTTDLTKIKLSDFGTSFTVQQHSVDVQYLVARYYRAPEIILGCEMPTDQRFGIDTWAVGCSLYELFTGKFLFEGGSNNQMIKLMMETKGKFSVKMLKKCKYFDKYFDSEFNFLYSFYDKSTKQVIIKKMQMMITPDRELLNLLKKNCRFDEDIKVLINFKDFLQQCLMLNPKNRLTPEAAFAHPFLNHMVKLS